MSEPATLEVEGLVKHSPCCGGLLRRRRGVVKAVDGVSFAIRRGETLGLVGESGCGKTTVSRLVLKLIEPTAGRIVLGGVDVTEPVAGADVGASPPRADRVPGPLLLAQSAALCRHHRRRADGELSASPRARTRSGAWPSCSPASACGQRASARYPHEFSGGQRQRLGIAKALSVNPDVIVADEPVSALDVSVRAQVLNLMIALQDELKLAYLFVSHDLAVVRHVSHRIAVMYLGRIVELADKRALFATPLHPYSEALLAAAPVARPSRAARKAGDPAGRRAEPDAAAERLPVPYPLRLREAPSAKSPIRRCSRWRRATTWPACGARSAAAWDRCRDRSEGRRMA